MILFAKLKLASVVKRLLIDEDEDEAAIVVDKDASMLELMNPSKTVKRINFEPKLETFISKRHLYSRS